MTDQALPSSESTEDLGAPSATPAEASAATQAPPPQPWGFGSPSQGLKRPGRPGEPRMPIQPQQLFAEVPWAEARRTLLVIAEEAVIHVMAIAVVLVAMKGVAALLDLLRMSDHSFWGLLKIQYLIDTFEACALVLILGSLLYQLFRRLRRIA